MKRRANSRSPAEGLRAECRVFPADVVRRSLEIAGDICIYTNRNIEVVEVS